MKSVVRKTRKETESQVKVAQCCAKISRNVVGCHD